MLSLVPQDYPEKAERGQKTGSNRGSSKGCSLTEFKISIHTRAFSSPPCPQHLVNTSEAETTVSMSECRMDMGFSLLFYRTPPFQATVLLVILIMIPLQGCRETQ